MADKSERNADDGCREERPQRQRYVPLCFIPEAVRPALIFLHEGDAVPQARRKQKRQKQTCNDQQSHTQERTGPQPDQPIGDIKGAGKKQ